MGLSFWLIPAEPLRSQLQAIISKVAAAENSPTFEPHMTIISVPLPEPTPISSGGQGGGADDSSSIPSLRESLRRIILDEDRYKELKIELKYPLFVGNSYFVSVVLALQPTESLVNFQKDVLSLVSEKLELSISGTSSFFPHVSLYYGDGESESLRAGKNKEREDNQKGDGSKEEGEERQIEGGRDKIAATITQEFGITSTEDAGNLILNGTREFKPGEIWVVKCVGPVEDWSVLERIQFQ